jgi:CzcA family heavy metal efflux pump
MFPFLERNRTVILAGTAVILAAGFFALFRIGSGIYPEVEFPRISVVVHLGDDPPEILQATAVRPVEEALATVLGVRRIRTRINRGAAEISLLFAPGTDMWRAFQFVNTRLAQVKGNLPPGAELEAERLTPAEFPVVTFNLVGGAGGTERREAAERIVKPAISRAQGVARVQVLGGDVREIAVVADPERLAAMRLRPSTLAARLSDLLAREAVGRVDAVRQTSSVVVEPAAREAEGLAGLPIASGANGPVALRSVAAVGPGAADRTVLVQAPEGDAVQVSASRLPGASTPDVVSGVLEAVHGLVLPPGMRLLKVYDQGVLVREAVQGVRDAILAGIFLTGSILALFLRDRRAGLLAALSVPLTLVATFGVMKLFDVSFNLMSLGGLAVAIGLVIDDAIVVVEAIAAYQERGAPIREAIARGLSDVTAPVIGTTLTTVVVFVPLVFLEGMVGRFFAALAVTLSAAVLLSLLFALLVLPVLAANVLRPVIPARRRRFRPRLRSRYGWLLRRVIHHRWAAVLAGAVLLAGGVLSLRRVETGFLPEFDEGAFVLDYFLPAGTSLAETDRVARKIEAVLTSTPGVTTWSRRTGAELGPITATVFNRGDITVLLEPRGKRRPYDELLPELRRRLAVEAPGARIEFVQLIEDVLSDLSGAPKPIEIRIVGDEPDELERAATDVAAKAEGLAGLVDYYSGIEGRVPTLELVPDADRLARLGLTPRDLTDDLAIALRGRVVGRVPWLDRLIDVRLRAPDAIRFSAAGVAGLPVTTPHGESLRVSAVATVSSPPRPSVLFRENLRPVLFASAAVEGGDLGGVAARLGERLRSVAPPRGGSIEIGGRAESAKATEADLAGVFLLGLLAVLAVLIGQFRAILPSLLILATVPPALAGAFALLWATDVPLNASSLIGLVLLAGLVVKNGILLVERAQRNAEAGMPPRLAALEAARRRLRPILMTTLCTIFGLLPLALGLGAAGEMQRPLAVAVVGGLIVSTAATLFVLPAFAAGRAIAPRPRVR